MGEWLNNIAGQQYASAVMWTVGALVLLVIVLFLIRLIRGVSSGTFVAGGRNRRARLAIMDAAAIDNQRRLVLVRRDDVEHLILIGGTTDVVVESNIVPETARDIPPARTGGDLPNGRDPRPAPEPAPPAPPRAALRERQEPVVAAEPAEAVATPASRAPEPPSLERERREPAVSPEKNTPATAASAARQNAPAPVSAPAGSSGSVHFLDKARIGAAPQTASLASLTAAASIGETRTAEGRAPEISVPAREAAVSGAAPGGTGPEPEPAVYEPRGTDLDTALRKELKEPLVSAPDARQPSEPSLEEEMKRLLGELSVPARN